MSELISDQVSLVAGMAVVVMCNATQHFERTVVAMQRRCMGCDDGILGSSIIVPLIGRFPSDGPAHRETGMVLPNNQRQHRTLNIQEAVLPYALC